MRVELKVLLGKLKKLLKKLFKNQGPNYYLSGDGTIIQNTKVEIRNGSRSKERCIFGKNSIISGQYVLETEGAKLSVGDRTFIGGGLFVVAEEIEIGSDILVSWGCTFIDTNAHSVNWEDRARDVEDWHKGLKYGSIGKFKDWSKVRSKKITIKDKAWIGFDCKILKGVTIGEGAIVGAGSVVTSDVPPYTVYAGNPAQFVKKIDNENMA